MLWSVGEVAQKGGAKREALTVPDELSPQLRHVVESVWNNPFLIEANSQLDGDGAALHPIGNDRPHIGLKRGLGLYIVLQLQGERGIPQGEEGTALAVCPLAGEEGGEATI